MKKTLLNILLGASLICGTNQLKAQEAKVNYWNTDGDNFPEFVLGHLDEGKNEKTNTYEKNKMGFTLIFYADKNGDNFKGDNFHEHIRIFNCNKFQSIVIEEFSIDKNTGLIDYLSEKHKLNVNKWNKYYSGKSFLDIAQKDIHKNLPLLDKKFYPNLTQQEVYNLYQGFGERVQRLINASENKDALKSMLQQERLRSESLK